MASYLPQGAANIPATAAAPQSTRVIHTTILKAPSTALNASGRVSTVPNYPSPCDSCKVKSPCGKGCKRWEIRYRYRQKQINLFAKKISGGTFNTKSWIYMHPDEYIAYLKTDPCKNCICSAWCDDPCPKYLAHFQAKMEHLRKRAERQ